jgi:hypothetical protein
MGITINMKIRRGMAMTIAGVRVDGQGYNNGR